MSLNAINNKLNGYTVFNIYEAEKMMIGRCAFEAFKVTNSVCGALSIILAISAMMFDIGFLPSFVVCLIWLVNQCVYCRAAAKCSKVLYGDLMQ